MRGVILFALLFGFFQLSAGIDLTNFEQVAGEFAAQKGREYNRQVRWWDIHLNQQHLKDTPQYHNYRIFVEVKNINYQPVSREVVVPAFTQAQWSHNNQADSTTSVLSFATERTESDSWSVTKGLTVGVELSASFGVPAVVDISTSIKTEVSLQSSTAKSSTVKRTYTETHTIPVPSHKSVKAVWTITEKKLDIPWTATVNIKGHIAVWFEEKYDGHWLWFFPIEDLANEKFMWSPNGGLDFTAEGTYSGVRGYESNVTTTEHPLQISKRSINVVEPIQTIISSRKLSQAGIGRVETGIDE